MALKTLSIKDFTGGRNSKAASPTLAANESLDQRSTWCENNALVKTKGWTGAVAQTSASNPVLAIQTALTPLGAAGTNRLVIMSDIAAGGVSGARLVYTDNGTTFTLCEATPTVFSGTAVPFMGMFRGKLYISDGTNNARSYDGTTVVDLGATATSFPNYNVCAIHKNYIFAASGNTVKWCNINDVTTWALNNFQNLDSDAGDSIIAMKSWGGNLIIFCKRSMWLLVGDVFDPIDAQYYLQKINTPSNYGFFVPEGC